MIGCWDNSIYIFNILYGSIVNKIIDAHDDSVNCLLVDHCNSRLLSGSSDCTLKICEFNSNFIFNNKPSHNIDNNSMITIIRATNNHNHIIYGDSEGYVYFYDILNLSVLH